MLNLLTGKNEPNDYPDPTPNPMVEEPWTAEAYLTSMRRLLNDAGKSGTNPAVMVAAAAVLVEAAKAAPRPALPVKTAPARTLPRDGGSL